MRILNVEIAMQYTTKYQSPVEGAVGHNKISIIAPCHRVVGSDGSLTGYAGGVDSCLNSNLAAVCFPVHMQS